MTEQTKAQRLADTLIDDAGCMEDEIARNPMLFGGSADFSVPDMRKAADELRRLDALNAELVEAVEAALSDDQPYIEKCRAALAKAKEQT